MGRSEYFARQPSGPRYFGPEEKTAEKLLPGKYAQSVYGYKW
jgi:hypothetical protein